MTRRIRKQLDSQEALEAFAARLGKLRPAPLVLYLQGPLGAGKTTFCRGLLRGSGYEGIVKSPTYTLVEPYAYAGDAMCYHFDLYRLADPEELEFTGSRDYFSEHSVCLVEWPEKAAGFLPRADIVCLLSYSGDGRMLEMRAETERGEAAMLGAFPDDLL